LLDAIEGALDLASDAEMLRFRCKRSANHEKTLCRLFDQIGKCRRFIQTYVKDVNFCKSSPSCMLFFELIHESSGIRSIKNIGGDTKNVIEDYRQMLKKLRDDFVSEAIVNVEIDVSRILVEVESISESIKGLGIRHAICINNAAV